VTTAAILVVVLAMASSTLFPGDVPALAANAAAATQAQASAHVDLVLGMSAVR
jgi:hypothetical protein